LAIPSSALDMAFAVFRAEPLEQSDLFIGQAELAFSGGPLQPLQPIVLVNRLWRCQTPACTAGGDLAAAQHQFLGDPHQGVGQSMIESRRRDLGGHLVWLRPLGTRQAVEQPMGAIGLKVAGDLIELLPAVADHPARPGDRADS
jgi:hypothetical protein